MAASLSFRVYTGSAAGTESAAVTGIDYISADNATNSLANRQANPITVGTNSYEKWMKMKVDTIPGAANPTLRVVTRDAWSTKLSFKIGVTGSLWEPDEALAALMDRRVPGKAVLSTGSA